MKQKKITAAFWTVTQVKRQQTDTQESVSQTLVLPWWTATVCSPGMHAGPQSCPSPESFVSSSGTHSRRHPCAATECIKLLNCLQVLILLSYLWIYRHKRDEHLSSLSHRTVCGRKCVSDRRLMSVYLVGSCIVWGQRLWHKNLLMADFCLFWQTKRKSEPLQWS